MPDKRTIYIDLAGRLDKYEASLKRAEVQTAKSGAMMGKAFDGVGKAIKGLGAAFIASKLLDITKQSIELFMRQEAAEKKLAVAYGKNTKALRDYASALQTKTGIGDEEIIEAQALIASFIKEEDAIKKLTQAALDLSVAKGMDLKAAADLLTKSVASSTNALSRYGITVEGAVGSTERLESAVKGINDAFGGQAAAQMETYAGKVAALSAGFGDLLEKVGKFAVTGIMSVLSGQGGAMGFGKVGFITDLQDQLAKAELSAKAKWDSQQKQQQQSRLDVWGKIYAGARPSISGMIGAPEDIELGDLGAGYFAQAKGMYTKRLDERKELERKFIDEITAYKIIHENNISDFIESSLTEQYNMQMGHARNIAQTLQQGFERAGSDFLSTLMGALDIAIQIAQAIKASKSSDVLGSISGFMGPLGGLFSLLFHEGGTVVNRAGKLTREKIPHFAAGGSFIVPGGYPNDSYPIMVESGERVTVTPASVTNNFNMNAKVFTQILSSIQALNMNLMNKGQQPIIINAGLDGLTFTERTTNPNQRRLNKEASFDV